MPTLTLMPPARVPISPAERAPLLDARREAKKTSSAHAFVRGSAGKFYEWLLSSRGESLPSAPPIWIGGDAHVGNLGPLARVDGAIELQIRDLDQTVIGSPAHDLVRLSLSMAMATRASGLPGVVTLHMIENIAHGYERALEARAARREHVLGGAPQAITRLLRLAGSRTRKQLLDERVGSLDGRRGPGIPIGRRFWPLTDEERDGVAALVESERFRKLITSLTTRNADDPVTLVDAAFWVKGVGSLGLWRCATLVQVGDARKPHRLGLVDIKEARAPAAPRAPGATLPRHDGERVVLGARALSPHLGSRMIWATVNGTPVSVRELLPQDLKFELDAMDEREALELGTHLGGVIGIAHARQLEPADCAAWLAELRRELASRTSAPAWLWAAVVDLVALHEGAYLEHCREHLPAAAAAVRNEVTSHHVTGD
jgi:uncharacterized protein (DUF2252 family)